MSTIKVDTVRPVTTDGNLTLQGDSSGSGVSGITIDSSGNVGVGTSSSGQKLDVSGDIQFGTSASRNLLGDSGGTTDLYLINYNSGTIRFHVGGGAAEDEKMRIDSSGDVTLTGNLSVPNFVGMIAAFAMSSAPTGWLVCNGAEYAIASYGDLYTAIGTTWGALTNGSGGAGSTHFVVPDLRGCFLRGTGQHGSLTTSNQTIAQTQNSKGSTLRVHGFAGETAAILFNSSADITTGSGEQGFATGYWSGTDSSYSRAGLEILTNESYPTNTAINYCIKY